MRLDRVALSWLMLLAACGGEGGAEREDPDELEGRHDGQLDAASDLPLDGALMPDAGQGERDASMPLDAARSRPDAAQPSGFIPCDVQTILDARCGTCHGKVPMGAPISLASLSDLHAVSSDGNLVYEEAIERINGRDTPMPPPSRTQLSASEKSKLEAWLSAGAKGASQACTPAPPPPEEEQFDYTQCDSQFDVLAHNGATTGDKTPFKVPTTGDHYECFYFTVPWNEKVHGLRIDPVIDTSKVVHHWLLYREDNTGSGSGTHAKCTGLHQGATLVAGWAPGGAGLRMPKDVGMQMPTGPNARFNIEIHYSNSTAGLVDRSGARVCVTKKLRAQEASTHWLGTETITIAPGAGTASGICKPTKTAHIIEYTPHMHKLGRRMKTIIKRRSGALETLTDRAFEFNDQQNYPAPGGEIVVGAGDQLTTTCSYQNDGIAPVGFGPGTNQEMCYNFVVAWPAGSLSTGGSLVVNDGACMR